MAQILASKKISAYIAAVSNRNKATAGVFASRLQDFHRYNNEQTDNLVEGINAGTIDVYDHFNGFISFLKKKGTLSDKTIGYVLKTARWFLEFHDVEVVDRKFKVKVKVPKPKKFRPSPLSKADVVKIINGMPDIRLKTYVMFLAATGCRAEEALSIRLEDIEFDKDPTVVKLHAFFTKTGEDRFVYLTREIKNQIKTWLEYKYRPRVIKSKDDKGKWIERQLVPARHYSDFVFLPYNEEYRNLTNMDSIKRVLTTAYHTVYIQFIPTISRMAFKKVTFHSFRRFVYTTIDSLGQNQFAEFFIGHSNSEYWSKPEHEKVATFRKCEPYLTYIDTTALEALGADHESRLEELRARLVTERESAQRGMSAVALYLIAEENSNDASLPQTEREMWKQKKRELAKELWKVAGTITTAGLPKS